MAVVVARLYSSCGQAPVVCPEYGLDRRECVRLDRREVSALGEEDGHAGGEHGSCVGGYSGQKWDVVWDVPWEAEDKRFFSQPGIYCELTPGIPGAILVQRAEGSRSGRACTHEDVDDEIVAYKRVVTQMALAMPMCCSTTNTAWLCNRA